MINQLKDIGLSENEAKVYTAMLELGPSTVLEISAKSGVNRPTAYVQIESLKRMGLVSSQTKGKKQLFIAEAPDQLEFVLDRERANIDQKKSYLEKLLPDLNSLFNSSGQKPIVRFFEGKEGLMKTQDELIRSGVKEVFGFSSADGILNIFPNHPRTYANRRVQHGIKSKLIYTSSHGAILPRHDEKALREAKYISPDKFPFDSDFTIYGDNVGLAALKNNLSGAIITHSELARSFRAIFELLWNSIE